MDFKLAREDEEDKVWISPELNNGDWPYRLLIRLENTAYWGDDPGFCHHCSVLAISPEACKKRWADAARCFGETVEWFARLRQEDQCLALMDFGIYAVLHQDTADKKKTLYRLARNKAVEVEVMFGIFMSKYQNAIGDSGWDWIRGETGNALIRRGKRKTGVPGGSGPGDV